MTSRSIFANLMRDADGTYSSVYGPFILRSALQPIFSCVPQKGLEIEAFEGLVRVFRNGEPVLPAEFFALVPPVDMADIDSILRTIHILNTGRMNRSRALIFVKFRPGLYRTPQEMRVEVDRIKLAAHEAGLGPDRIVCEISEKSGTADDIVVAFTEHMRAIGFRVAIAGYGAGDADLARLRRIKPDYVKFDAEWIRDSVSNSAGHALVRVIVRQMLDEGIKPIFEALEEVWQIDLCEELSVPLMQGYALAQPEIAPTTFNEVFPETLIEPLPSQAAAEDAAAAPPVTISPDPVAALTLTTSALAKPARAFGRRVSIAE